jgi:ubiquinol-cytochrome c reductase cytochrome b subunit
VIALVLSIAILFILPFTNNFKFQRTQFYPINQIIFWIIVTIVILLTWIGARPVEDPFIITGQLLTCFYFLYYISNPLISIWWEKSII